MLQANYILVGVSVIVSIFGFQEFQRNGNTDRFVFSPYDTLNYKKYLGAFLSNFSHSGFFHLGFNMMALLSFGNALEYSAGTLVYLLIYLLSTVGSTLLVFATKYKNPNYRCLGASGSVSGVVFASIVIDPSQSVQLLLIPIPIPGPLFALAFLILSFYFIKEDSIISHEAHLGGAGAGLLVAALVNDRGIMPLLEATWNLVNFQ